MNRHIQKLVIQIYNQSNNAVEYSNGKTVPDFGIDSGTALLDRVIMPDEIKFGEMYANMFQAKLFGLPENVNLKGRRIRVFIYFSDEVYNTLVDSDADKIVNEEGTGIAVSEGVANYSSCIFIGYINTSDTDIVKTDRIITAYDTFYTLKNLDIASWWNTYWANNTSGVTIQTFRNALLTNIGFSNSESTTYVNDNIVIKNPFQNNVNSLMLSKVIKAICQLQCTCPNMGIRYSQGVPGRCFEFIKLSTTVDHDLRDNTEGLNSKWEDFTTETITGVGVYDTSEELAQLTGTADNVYKISGNMFLLNMSATDITTVCTNILNELSGVTYTPCELNLVISDFTHNLGDKLSTPNGYAYIMQQTFSGSLLINENIVSPAINPTLTDKVDDVNDELIDAMKFSKINHTIDEFSSEIYDPDTGDSRIDQLANQIVLKVKTNGGLVVIDLDGDPDDGSVPTLNLQANKVNITSDTIQFDNDGYQVKGKVYTTKITPDNNEIFCNYENIDKTYFPFVDFEDDTKALKYSNTYFSGTLLDENEDVVEQVLESFNVQFIRNIFLQNKVPSQQTSFDKYDVVVGPHLVMTEEQWTAYVNAGGYIYQRPDEETETTKDVLQSVNNLVNYFEPEVMYLSYVSRNTNSPTFAYLLAYEADAVLHFMDYSLDYTYIILQGFVPVVIAPRKSLSPSQGICDWQNKWGSSGANSSYGLLDVSYELWKKTMSDTKSGTVVKTITATNPQKIFTSADLASIFGVTAMSGTITAYLMNGDHAAQGVDIIATYIQSGEVYARFSTTPTAGNYRFNYTISRY